MISSSEISGEELEGQSSSSRVGEMGVLEDGEKRRVEMVMRRRM